MNKYLISKIVAIFFGATTVVIFLMANTGALFTYAGSMQAGVALYAINTAGLVVSLLAFFWLRAHKDLPMKQELDTLEAYAAINSTEQDNELVCLLVDTDELLKLGSGVDEMITVLKQDNVTRVHAGDEVRLVSPTEVDGSGVVVTVLSVNGNQLEVRVSSR